MSAPEPTNESTKSAQGRFGAKLVTICTVLGSLAGILALGVTVKMREQAEQAADEVRKQQEVTLQVSGAGELDFLSRVEDEGGFSPALSRSLLLVNTGQVPVQIVSIEVLTFPVTVLGAASSAGMWQFDYVRAIAAEQDEASKRGVWMSSTEGCSGSGPVTVLPGQVAPFVALTRPPELRTESGAFVIMPDRSEWTVRVTLANGAQMKMIVDSHVVSEVRNSVDLTFETIRDRCRQPGVPVSIVEVLERPTS